MAITQVATIAALKSEGTPNPATGVRFVKNHTSTTDEGGGVFEWDDNSALTDNNGTVIEPDNHTGSGRWIRQVDVRGAVHPEWWGVIGDGTTADYNRLKQCFASIRVGTVYPKKPKVVFLAKTYFIKGELHGAGDEYVRVIELKEGEVVEGQGIDKTILAARTEDGLQESYKIVVIRAGIPTQPQYDVDDVIVRNLTIDCGFNQSSRARTREGLELYGQSTLVERVKVMNFGVGYVDPEELGDAAPPGECFPIFLSTQVDGGRIGTIRDCEMTEPGVHNMEILPQGHTWPEITALTVMGRGKANNQAVLGVGGAIVGNRVHDIPQDTSTSRAYQPSQPHAITVAACRGTEVADNEVINCDGVGVYIASWTDENVVVRNNRLINVNIGVGLGIMKNEIDDGLLPQHTGTIITDNFIVPGRVKVPAADLTMIGVSAFCDSGISSEQKRFKDITVARNLVRGNIIQDGNDKSYPVGVRLMLHSEIFENLEVEYNVLEIPDADDSQRQYDGADYPAGFNTPYENALVFWPQTIDASTIAHRPELIRFHGNRNLSATDLRLKVMNMAWENQELLYPPVRVWREFSDRLKCYQRPVFEGAGRCHYDEFLGSTPKSLFGWVNASSGGGSLAAESPGQVFEGDEHPGIVKVQAGATNGSAGTIRSGSAGIMLGGGVTHVLTFAVKRSGEAATGDDYECRMGLLKSPSDDEGVYFRVYDHQWWPNQFLFQAKSSTAEVQDPYPPWNGYTYPNGKNDTLRGNPPEMQWRTCRIEVVPEPAAGVSLAARFYYDGVLIGEAKNTQQSSPIPVESPLYIVFKAERRSGTTERWLLLDYVQHLVLL